MPSIYFQPRGFPRGLFPSSLEPPTPPGKARTLLTCCPNSSRCTLTLVHFNSIFMLDIDHAAGHPGAVPPDSSRPRPRSRPRNRSPLRNLSPRRHPSSSTASHVIPRLTASRSRENDGAHCVLCTVEMCCFPFFLCDPFQIFDTEKQTTAPVEFTLQGHNYCTMR